METSYSGANHAVLHAQSDRGGLGPIETIISGRCCECTKPQMRAGTHRD